jgi:hypothetical protein
LSSLKKNAKKRIVNKFHTSLTIDQHVGLYRQLTHLASVE